MPINVISDAPHIPRCILRADADARPASTAVEPQAIVTTAVTAENWDFVHWQQFRYEIVDALARFPDALQAFIGVVESFRARALEVPTG